MESSLNQNSVSVPQDSKFSLGNQGDMSQSAMKNVASSRADDMQTPDMIA